MNDPLRILHLSDTHLFGDGSLHYGVVDTLAALDRVLDRAAALDAVDAVVVSGDLSDDGSPESYQLLADRLAPWAAGRGAQVVPAMGNHDDAAAFERVLGDRERTVGIRGFRIVTVDSTIPGAGYGRVEGARLDRLAEALAEPAPNGTVVVLHHPPVPPTTRLFDSLRFVDPAPFLAVCAAADVRVVLAGHFHHALATTAGPHAVPVVVSPAVANTVDVLAPRGHDVGVRGSGFTLLQLPATGPVRAHAVTAPHPHDGAIVYDLDGSDIGRIAAVTGWRGENR
ncbi:metallophosphoesterase [Leifsonia poae]|uniref:metallophosphoesterase n=1 Tax=Leifsonia poae TaxID=110933 RepID=UPI001CBF5054|nr:metallophosphoesterase [Leifsonia poae]